MIDLNTAYSDLPILTFKDREVIIKEGKKASGLYFLKSGKVGVFRGKESIFEQGEVGSVFGDVATLLDSPALAESRAIGDVSLYFVAEVEAFLLERPEVMLHLSRGLAKKVNFMASYLTDLKQQYAGEENHLGMVHEVLDSFLGK